MTKPDPFQLFDLEPALDVDPAELEARYLALSRASHPDHHAAADPARMAELLARSAAVNDAYRALRDPWTRARLLIDRADPAAFEAHKRLDPAFLADALELAEEVAEVGDDDARRADLEARLRGDVAGYLDRIAAALAAGDAARAATLLHESNYHRKALSDLTAGVQGGPGGPR